MNHNKGESPAPEPPAQVTVSGWSLESDKLQGGCLALTGALIIGRGSDCDLVIDDSHLSRRHAAIRVADTCLQVEDLGSANGTYLNGERISQAEAHHGDEIWLDQLVFRVTGPQSGDFDATQLRDPDATALHVAVGTAMRHRDGDENEHTRVLRRGKAWFVMTDGQRCEIAAGRIRIGRAPDNDLVLDDPSVSSHHAELSNQLGQWILTDLQSTNGTCVDGRSVEQAQLSDGARVRFGELDMQLVLDSHAQPRDAPPRAGQRSGNPRRKSPWLWFGLLVLITCAVLVLLLMPRSG
ncbi:FHA domain-containing protein [Marinobacterium rhizophilum]|uniref:FHA domain-containing protein n=1 Tax=Marinobacterium rhizophilum TaxID=420402 RepID=UPI00037F513A|nr:FHA domain-containing protein [Marinobacterium rhizophilum]